MAFGYRSSTGALDRFDDYEPPARRPERWDREKFERMSRRPPHDDRETFRWVEPERDDYPPRPPRSRADVALDDRLDTRSSRGRFDERDRFYEDEIIDRRGPGRRPDFLDREEPSPAEEDFIIVKRALEKPQIDEVIKISETYKAEDNSKLKLVLLLARV
ncbi:hypothetical protein UCDDS831_g04143 [Diplodia seriata]|uniref:DUF8035 domain-containing protein n=1 Tax=Diplodia seriata TaxID=420778 RepID=A0A0G2GE51_9PEZI|nr:hypothetical protein UCDDS831_g04143 [Diplodia seriata]